MSREPDIAQAILELLISEGRWMISREITFMLFGKNPLFRGNNVMFTLNDLEEEKLVESRWRERPEGEDPGKPRHREYRAILEGEADGSPALPGHGRYVSAGR